MLYVTTRGKAELCTVPASCVNPQGCYRFGGK